MTQLFLTSWTLWGLRVPKNAYFSLVDRTAGITVFGHTDGWIDRQKHRQTIMKVEIVI